jgi:hypothetical protein
MICRPSHMIESTAFRPVHSCLCVRPVPADDLVLVAAYGKTTGGLPEAGRVLRCHGFHRPALIPPVAAAAAKVQRRTPRPEVGPSRVDMTKEGATDHPSSLGRRKDASSGSVVGALFAYVRLLELGVRWGVDAEGEVILPVDEDEWSGCVPHLLAPVQAIGGPNVVVRSLPDL